MSCYLILRKWENPQLPAKKQVFKRFGLMTRDPYKRSLMPTTSIDMSCSKGWFGLQNGKDL